MKRSTCQGRTIRTSPVFSVENLEKRSLLAVGFSHGLVNIRGTIAPDVIDVSEQGQELVVNFNGVSTTFDLSIVKGLRINALGGDDDVTIEDGVTVNASLLGGSGNDDLKSGDGNDSLRGGPGDDMLEGGLGNDNLKGDAGEDHVCGDDGNDSVDGGLGDDSLEGGTGDDSEYGQTGNDDLAGDEGDDTLDGGVGDDSLDGGAGNDDATGDAGNDDIIGDDGDDSVDGGLGDDSLDGGTGNDEIHGDLGNDELHGEEGNDSLDGGLGDDQCLGGADNDSIHGGEGDDQLDGEGGDNLLDGDGGNNEEQDGMIVDFDADFIAPLHGVTGSAATGHAEFEVKKDPKGFEVDFDVHIEHALPNSAFDVLVDHVLVGQVSTDEAGNGDLRFSSNASDLGLAPFPESFPALHFGSQVLVDGLLEGLFGLQS